MSCGLFFNNLKVCWSFHLLLCNLVTIIVTVEGGWYITVPYIEVFWWKKLQGEKIYIVFQMKGPHSHWPETNLTLFRIENWNSNNLATYEYWRYKPVVWVLPFGGVWHRWWFSGCGMNSGLVGCDMDSSSVGCGMAGSLVYFQSQPVYCQPKWGCVEVRCIVVMDFKQGAKMARTILSPQKMKRLVSAGAKMTQITSQRWK